MIFLDLCDELITPIEEHSSNVAKTSLRIFDHLSDEEKAKVLPFEAKDYKPDEIIVICGLYHDIGKTFIKQSYPCLLNKEKFNLRERAIMKQHTIMGAEIVQKVGIDNDVDPVLISYIAQTCMFHHEKLNGSGYFMLKDIPLLAQLVTVADVFSAGIEKRPYEGVKDIGRLREEMYSMSINQSYVEALFKEGKE